MRFKFVILLFILLPACLLAQKQKADSLYQLLAKEKIDSNRVTLMWKIGDVTNIYDPERALIITQEALFLAKNIKFAEGQSRSLGIIGNIFIKLGNYPQALEFYLQKLKLEEKSNKPRNLASVLMSIGIVYVFQEQYNQALQYYYKSDSVINKYNMQDIKYNIALSLGDVYDRLNISDSAFSYYNKSLSIANEQKNNYFIGVSMTGIGHSYRKMGNYSLSQANYRSSIAYLKEANADDLLCEATLGLATLFQKLNNTDSAVYYANISRSIAVKDGFMPRLLDAANFLADHYKRKKNVDSAFSYMNLVKDLNDSINSKSRIRESQVLSSNEQLRQLEIAENKKIARKERVQQLQLLFIAMFIPGFFLLTLLLSRIKIHIRVIKILGILSLLILFEYLTLLLHPYVLAFTNHTPVYEMLIFVTIAAILIPGHHRIEGWLIKWLIKNRPLYAGGRIRYKAIKLKKSIS